jgi:hypothetical protein
MSFTRIVPVNYIVRARRYETLPLCPSQRLMINGNITYMQPTADGIQLRKEPSSRKKRSSYRNPRLR